MTPKVSDTGHSFKGAFSYYLNDKRADPADPHPATSERVAWTETRNLATDSPHMAWRVMVATASQADELKREAGVRNTGRKATGGPVFSYSLAWRDDEAAGVTREDMARAADDTLKLLKADHLQAVIVCHRDTPNPHVHVVVNRIDPATGKTHSFGQSHNKLSDWAARYERDRGVIVTPQRQEAEAAREEARKRPKPETGPSAIWAKRKREEKARQAEQARKPEQAAPAPRIAQERPKTPGRTETPASRLKALGDQQKARHATERERLWTDQKARSAAIFKAAGQELHDRAATAKAENRPQWAEHYRQQKAEQRAYEARERYLSGKVRNAIDAVRSRQIRGDGSDQGFLTMAFGYLASRDARRAELDTRQQTETKQLAATLKARLDTDMGRIKEARDRQLTESRQTFTADKAKLTEKQAGEIADVRAQWKAIYAERERVAQGRRAASPAVTSRDHPAPQERPVMKDEFDRARREPQRPAPPVPNRTVTLSKPAPAPSPAGDVPAVKKSPAIVPAIDRDAAFKAAGQSKPPPAPRVAFTATIRTREAGQEPPTRPQPPTPPKAPERPQGQPARFDWTQALKPAPVSRPDPAPRIERDRQATPPAPPRAPERPQPPREEARKAQEQPQARPAPAVTPELPRREQERPGEAEAPRRAAFDWTKATSPAPQPERTQDAPRFDWGKALEPSRDTPRPDTPRPERKRDFDRDR